MNSTDYYLKVNELLQAGTPFVSVILVDANGSIPQNIGAKMLVTGDGIYAGTVGGGKVERKAIEEAQSLLSKEDKTGQEKTHFVNWSLTRDVGMTCGGSVKLFFEKHNAGTWSIVVFGAGHIANALIDLLLKLECQITCIDPRPEWLDRLPDSPKLKRVLEPDMPSRVCKLSDKSFVVLMTMGHSTDMPILFEIFKQERQFPYLGVIGSKAKAARLHQDIDGAGFPSYWKHSFYCPMGLEFGSNHPQEIAFSIVGQLLEKRDALQTS